MRVAVVSESFLPTVNGVTTSVRQVLDHLRRMAALRGLDSVSLAIVGDGSSAPLVRRQLAGMPVTWLGKLPGTDLATAYGSFDLFLNTGTSAHGLRRDLQPDHPGGTRHRASRGRSEGGGPIDLVEHAGTRLRRLPAIADG